ncbi:hypothetical protein ABPG74_019802 [Tetrahymena malaccensis]
MIRLILLLSIIGICLAQINLRRYQESYLLQNTCQNPCTNNIKDILPGLTIGQRISIDGLTFEQIQSYNVMNYCCDKHKTDKSIGRKFIVPDFVDVSESHLPDIQTINATISNATKDENQTSDYKIEINHLFQRRALNLSTDLNQITLNMSLIKQNIFTKHNLDLENCEQNSADWLNWIVLYNLVGDYLLYQQVLGVFMNATFVFYTNETYTQEFIISTYWKFIQNNPIDEIERAFQKAKLSLLSIMSIGNGVNFGKSRNWNKFLSNLGPQNYVFTQSEIPGEEQLYKDFDSYEIFNSYSKQVQECSKKMWDYHSQNQLYKQI